MVLAFVVAAGFLTFAFFVDFFLVFDFFTDFIVEFDLVVDLRFVFVVVEVDFVGDADATVKS